MTEQEWLSTEDVGAMLKHLRGSYDPWPPGDGTIIPAKISDRKAHLFACACGRAVWDKLTDPRSRRAVEVAERLADDGETLTSVAYAEAASARLEATRGTIGEGERAWLACAAIEGRWQRWELSDCVLPLDSQANLLRDIVGNPFLPLRLPKDPACKVCDGKGRFHVGMGEEAEVYECRCCPWLSPTVVSLAQAAYDNPRDDGTLDPDRLAVLSDALEEAGCTDSAILMPLRGYSARCGFCDGSDVVFWAVTNSGQFDKTLPCGSCEGTGWHVATVARYRGFHVLDVLLKKE